MADSSLSVLLGADSLIGPRSGIGRQALEVARCLRRVPDLAELVLLIGANRFPASGLDAIDLTTARDPAPLGRGARAVARTIPGAQATHAWWQRWRLNRLADAMARRTNGQVVYHEFNTIARRFDGPMVATMHDLSWLEDARWHTPQRVAWLQRRLPQTLAQATRFVSVSHFTADAMQRLLGVARSRIDVVSPGVSAMFRPVSRLTAAPVMARLGLQDRGYLLAVSTLEPRKNLARLVEAQALLPDCLRRRVPLLIAGGAGWGDALAGDRAAQAQRSGTLRLLGHVADADLVALYARCAAAVYVSLYEGFGLPVLEAMACGAPVVASATTAVGQTAGDAALLVTPEDPHDIAEALCRVLTDRVLTGSLIERGQQRAAGYSWERMTAGLIATWHKALEG